MSVSPIREFTRRHPKIIDASLFVVSFVLTFTIAETVFRIYLKRHNPVEADAIQRFIDWANRDDTLFRFSPHPYTTYVPSHIHYEKNGLRIENKFYSFRKKKDVIRVACLGGSTTMKKFPSTLEQLLNRWPGDKTFEVMDFGCDGWTLTESSINFMLRVADFRPDFVIVHHGANDGSPRLWPNFQPDYAHFRKPWSDPPVPFWAKKIAPLSWIVTFFLNRTGLSAFDIQNQVIHRVKQEEILQTPDATSLEPYERNLRLLAAMVKETGGQLIVAPMPHNRLQGGKRGHETIDDCNRSARNVAQQLGLPVADTETLLQNHPEWFMDWVHVTKNGDFLKAQVYSLLIWNLLNGNQDVRVFTPKNEKRDLELRWIFDSENVREFQIHVRAIGEHNYIYMGRTFTGDVKSYRWKAGSPEHAPGMKPEFKAGPEFGHYYVFKVAAISKTDPPRVIGHLTTRDQVKVFERLVENNDE